MWFLIFIFMLAAQCSTDALRERALFGRLAQKQLIAFARVTSPDPVDPYNVRSSAFEVRPHHQLIASALERVKRREIKRLLITVPPSHGKSELSVRKFLPWVWGDEPRAKFIVGTYAAGLAHGHGRDVRRLMLSNEYRFVFGGRTALADDSQAMDYMETTAGGKATFVGLDGTVTGKHADYFIIDDPIKGSRAARSQTVRDTVWQNLIEVCFTRRMSVDSPIILIMTRWNEDDPAARFIDPKNPYYSKERAANWVVIHLRGCIMTEEQAKADPLRRQVGQALWEEKMSAAEYQEMNRSDRVTRQTFLTLYQGDPAPIDGTFFLADWLVPYGPNDLPKRLKKYCASDHAVRTDQENDSTCIGSFGVDDRGDIWLLPDLWWDQKPTDIVVDTMMEKMRQHRPVAWFSGKDHITGAIKPFLNQRMFETRTFCIIRELSDVRDKEAKAQSIQGRMAQKRVHFPVFAPWWPRAQAELMGFPHAVHNDFVDMLANLGRGLDELMNADGAMAPENRPDPRTLSGIKHYARRGDAMERAEKVRKGW